MTQVAAWVDDNDKNFLAILAVVLLEHPEYKFEVHEDTLCVVKVGGWYER